MNKGIGFFLELYDENGVFKLEEKYIIEHFSSIKYDQTFDDVFSLSIDEDDFGEVPNDELYWDKALNPKDYILKEVDEHYVDVSNKWEEDEWDELEEEFDNCGSYNSDYSNIITITKILTIAETEEELDLEIALEEKLISYELMQLEKEIANIG